MLHFRRRNTIVIVAGAGELSDFNVKCSRVEDFASKFPNQEMKCYFGIYLQMIVLTRFLHQIYLHHDRVFSLTGARIEGDKADFQKPVSAVSEKHLRSQLFRETPTLCHQLLISSFPFYRLHLSPSS